MEEDRKEKKPTVLIILSGWGIAPPTKGNAIVRAKTPTFDYLVKTYPSSSLVAAGESIGLPAGEAGNSEIGSLVIGSGRPIFNDLSRINQSIKNGSFFENEPLLEVASRVRKSRKSVHLIGLVSSGEVYSSIKHLYALLDFFDQQKIKKVFLHLILDGRDSAYNSGAEIVAGLQAKLTELGIGKIASLSGRYYAMDRDSHWDRTLLAYRAIFEGRSERLNDDPVSAIEFSYGEGVYDEEFVPTVVVKNKRPVASVNSGDLAIFFNFKSDRIKQLVKAVSLPSFEKFSRSALPDLEIMSLTQYDYHLPVKEIFTPEVIDGTLPDILSSLGLSQLYLAETEKYGYLTHFFHGYRDDALPGEKLVLIPSLNTASYKSNPGMSAKAITKRAVKEIMSDEYDFLAVNFANLDVVGHSGDFKATIKAAEIVDSCIRQINETVLRKDGNLIITADHGSAEEMLNLQSGEVDCRHTSYPVPIIVVGNKWEGKTAGFPEAPNSDLSLIKPTGSLADVAPTILKIMGLKKPPQMSGKSLV